MHEIWKFELEVKESQSVFMPKGAEPLSVQYQGINLVMWARVKTDANRYPRKVHIYATGMPCDDSLHLQFVGTVQTYSYGYPRQLVWHVFVSVEDKQP